MPPLWLHGRALRTEAASTPWHDTPSCSTHRSSWAPRRREAASTEAMMALPMIGYYEQPSAATSWPGWGCLSSRLPRKSSPQAGSHVPSRPPVRVVGSCRSATDGTTGRESKRRDGFKNDPVGNSVVVRGLNSGLTGVTADQRGSERLGRGSSTGGPSRRQPHDECTKGSSRIHSQSLGRYVNATVYRNYFCLINEHSSLPNGTCTVLVLILVRRWRTRSFLLLEARDCCRAHPTTDCTLLSPLPRHHANCGSHPLNKPIPPVFPSRQQHGRRPQRAVGVFVFLGPPWRRRRPPPRPPFMAERLPAGAAQPRGGPWLPQRL